MTKQVGVWIDYLKATPEQQEAFRTVNPLLEDFKNYMLYITKLGRVSRAKGLWCWTEAYAKEVDRAIQAKIRDGQNVRSKGDLRGFKTATFHLDNKFSGSVK